MSTQIRGLSGTINPNIRPGMRPSASVTARIYRMILGMHGIGDITVKVTASGIEIGSRRRRRNQEESKVIQIPSDFGIKSIVGQTVTLYSGRIWIGKDEMAAAETPLTLNTDSYVGWEHPYGGSGLTIKSFGSTFNQDDGYLRKVLYHFAYTAPVAPATVGSIRLDRGCALSEAYPANWGKYT